MSSRLWSAMPSWSIAAVAILAGLVAEQGWPATIDPLVVAGDLMVGWLFVVAGLAVRDRQPANRQAVILVGTAFAWFAGTLVPGMVFLHRGPLLHLAAAGPNGRVRGRAVLALVAAGYVVAAIAPLSRLDVVSLGVGCALVACAVRATTTRPVSIAIATVGVVLAAATAARIAGGSPDSFGFVAYQAALAALAIAAIADVALRGASDVVTRFVVDLGGTGEAGTLRDRLARAIGDPSLVLGFVAAAMPGAFVDDAGRPVAPPAATRDQAVTPIVVGGRPMGFVAHDRTIGGDPRTVALLAAAAGLAMSNSATAEDIQRRVGEVAASRRRLVTAGDAEVRAVEERLDRTVEVRLSRVTALLMRAAEAAPESREIRDAIGGLADARRSLSDLAIGIYPASLTKGGLASAIADLTSRSPRSIETAGLVGRRFDATIEATCYFVCAESLVNVEKHAGAARVRIEVEAAESTITVAVTDDGRGGASVEGGSGLRGLTDRVEALGGQLTVDSRPGSGTTVRATLPARMTSEVGVAASAGSVA